jgi:DnaJ-class molecular chaperone
VDTLRFLNALSEWKTARYEKKISEMRSQGICPDCHGKGFHSLPLNEFLYTDVYDCPGCNGSGLFSDWSETNQQYN